MAVAFIGLPDELASLADSVPFNSVAMASSWAERFGDDRSFDAIHAFTKQAEELTTGLPRLQDAIRRDGMIWVSWPKKASKVATDVTEDTVRAAALSIDLVDVKVAAVDAIWSGLKLVIRKERR
ncbi:DUF3052 domain-containing protein [Kaistia algarum]|uniref:DUF3052 domain-containing protein n=1 Tax=Kaistia algarum TaxID=2083279 RepID=UPI00225920EF|nr:DUF3052 domain-containing protein [Kaistia algarum]MCX5514461.1 DUF3052 domain-containing protein [Kaistia algarum]